MAQFFQIHPENPQGRLVNQAADILQRGGLAAFPTDSAYAIGCHLGDKNAVDRIRQIRQLDKHHNFTLMCRDLSELATYAKVSNAVFRMLKAHTPGPYTFVLEATSEVPRRVMHAKRKTIGLRVPANNIARDLIEALGEPIMTSTLIMPGDEYPMTDPYDIRETLEHQLDLVVDGGYCGMEATTVIDLSGEAPELIRQGCGSYEDFIA